MCLTLFIGKNWQLLLQCLYPQIHATLVALLALHPLHSRVPCQASIQNKVYYGQFLYSVNENRIFHMDCDQTNSDVRK